MKFVETHLGKGMDGNITAHHRSSERTGGHAGVCEERPPSCKPLPRHPSAEPALQPLNWSFDSLSAQESFFFGGVVCLNTHTHTNSKGDPSEPGRIAKSVPKSNKKYRGFGIHMRSPWGVNTLVSLRPPWP